MSNTERVPVKVYRWDDAGAPQVMPVDGAVKTILKACLVTGYGENENRKEPLGWEMPFENGNAACFRSTHEKSTKWALGVYGTAQYGGCEVVGLKDPTSVKTGAKEAVFAKYGKPLKFMYGSSRRNSKEPLQWVVVGHDRAFCLLVINANFSSICGNLYFGDFPSFALADDGNCAISMTTSNSYLLDAGTNYQQCFLMEDYSGNILGQAELLGRMGVNNNEAVNYPNPVTGGFSAENVLIFEKNNQNRSMLRGQLPGFKFTFEAMPSPTVVPYGQVYKNLDSTDDEWMYFKTVNNLGMLVNLTTWNM